MRILTHFMSQGKSLSWWQEEGVLSREILLYRAHLVQNSFDLIQVFTYDARDVALLARYAQDDPVYERLTALGPAQGKAGLLWWLTGVLRHRRAIAASTVLKTNQVSGAWAAILATLLFRRPFLFRMGYILSRRFALNGQKAKAFIARLVEHVGGRVSSRIVVTSQDAFNHFDSKPKFTGKVRLLPTYVDTGMFTAKTDYDFDLPVIAVGRMRPQKNLPALLEACKISGVGLTLVGRGEQEEELKAQAEQLGLAVRFIPQIDNADLALLMAEHSIFALPSLHEGLPKVLIEAMATGLICVGTRIPGTSDLVEDGKTGFLADGFDAQSIATAITRARKAADPGIGAAARALVETRFGLTGFVQKECDIIRDVA